MIKLYNGDCLEVMKDIPDKSIDLVVTEKENQVHKWKSGLGNYNRDELGRFI